MTTPLTADQREELRRLEAAATPGPWSHDNRAKGTEGDPCLFTESGPSYSPGKSPIFTAPAFWTAADGDLCAAARNALPALLDAADRADELAEWNRFGAERYAKLLEQASADRLRVKALEGLLGEALPHLWHSACPRETYDRIAKELARPQPGDERRDEQGEPEQLIGPGDDPNDRDDR
jgi:hypothetical protein